MATIERAIELAAAAHAGARDWGGAPYILHPLRVMMQFSSTDEMITAVLHDVLEDTPVTIARLRKEGFSRAVIQAVSCLTRRDGEDYLDFILRVNKNLIARNVKIADLEDNMDVKRLGSMASADVERLVKYHRAWCILKAGVECDSM